MLYINVPLGEWLERHKLDTTMERCKNCEQLYTLDVPIIIKGYAGLEMQKHGCPDNFLAATFTPTEIELELEWKNIMNGFRACMEKSLNGYEYLGEL